MNDFKKGRLLYQKKIKFTEIYSALQIVCHSLTQQTFTIFRIKYGVTAEFALHLFKHRVCIHKGQRNALFNSVQTADNESCNATSALSP